MILWKCRFLSKQETEVHLSAQTLADRRSWTAHMPILFIFQFISKLTTEMLSTQSLISFVASVSDHLAQGNVQTVSKYLKFNPSSPVRCSSFASQPYISFFTSLCAPLCLGEATSLALSHCAVSNSVSTGMPQQRPRLRRSIRGQ